MKLRSFRNLPLSVKISFLTLVMIAAVALIGNIVSKSQTVDDNMGVFADVAAQSLDSIEGNLQSGNVVAACELMQKASDRQLVSFFIIQLGRVPICFAPVKEKDRINLQYNKFNQNVHNPNYTFDFRSINVNKYVATAGWLNNSRANLTNYFLLKLPTMLLGLFLVVSIIGIIVFRETKPIQKLLTVFKKSGKVSDHLKSGDHGLLGQAAEIRQLWKSAYEIEKSTEKLKNEVRFVSQDAQNFLRREITQKKDKIPYRFFSSMLRFDMNNYTKTFVEDPEATQVLISRLSIEADELVHRYEGLHYAFGGDEFIVVFRDTDKWDSKAMAFSCIRDIFTQIDKVFNSVQSDHKITMKASISHSENVLFELPNGLFLRGLNLILSQRYLTTVSAKDANKLVVNYADLKSLSSIAEFSNPVAVNLKGIAESYEVTEPLQYTSVQKVLNDKLFTELRYFRGDDDIVFLLREICSSGITDNEKMKILEHLKGFEVCRSGLAISDQFIDTFLFLDKNVSEHRTILSSLLSAGEKLIPVANWSDDMSQLMLNANCKSDSRCNSSLLRLLAAKATRENFDRYANQILQDAPSTDFRSVGNFLIAKAETTGLSDKLLRECSRMLKSKNDLELATGIYVSSRIIQAQKRSDPVAMSQFEIIPDLIARIQTLRAHSDGMVSARALVESRELNHLESA